MLMYFLLKSFLKSKLTLKFSARKKGSRYINEKIINCSFIDDYFF